MFLNYLKGMLPTKVFFTKGVGVHKDKLASFELALRSAGIEKCNIVNISSIFPPNCKKITKEEGIQLLQPGQITHCVLARNCSDESNRLLAASIGCALPADRSNHYGYLSEHHSFGETAKTAGDYAEYLAATMLASTLGIKYNLNKEWRENKQFFRASDLIFKTTNITQSALCNGSGQWTTVVAAAVFLE